MGREILVYSDFVSDTPVLIGNLFIDILRGKEVFSFEYSPLWLQKWQNIFLDPDLYPFSGRQYLSAGKEIFGLFSDISPDRWGRVLMKRREALLAKSENRAQRRLGISDYLLGVDDASRMGGIRLKENENSPFLSSSSSPVPLWANLRELENASLLLESTESAETDIKEYIRLLLAPGSSLGGARPKASVISPDSTLWIAKFPSRNDEWDIGAWEMVVHDLASLCSLKTVDAKCEKFSKNGSTFLTKRFDREGKRRVHFMSALTATGKTDGSDSTSGSSYLEIAGVIEKYGSSPREDLKELWKRIAFSIAVTNTDDHLRNHGFLVNKRGLTLSPLYDVNPAPDGVGLSLNIDENSNELDFTLAVDSARYYGVKKDEAALLCKRIRNTVAQRWKSLAVKYGIPREEIEMMSHCFAT